MKVILIMYYTTIQRSRSKQWWIEVRLINLNKKSLKKKLIIKFKNNILVDCRQKQLRKVYLHNSGFLSQLLSVS